MVRTVREKSKCQWAIDSSAQLDKKDRLLEAGGTELVIVSVRNSLDEAVESKFSEIITELRDGGVAGLEGKLVEHGTMEFGCGPSA